MSKQLALALLLACNHSTNPGEAVDAPPSHPSADAPASTTPDAPTSSAIDPATDGTSAVTVATVTIPAGTRSAPATTFVPDSPAPRPLVFVSPGFQMARTQYASYAHHLATWGFTVVLADYTDTGFFADHQMLADDISLEITWALAQTDLGIDAAKIATAGHSLGGMISVLVAADDARVKAVVGWDPVDGGSPATIPKVPSMHAALAVIGETTDGAGGGMPCAPTASNYQQFYAGAPSPALEMNVPTADHMDWVDDPSCAFCTLCTAGTAPADLARTATRRLNVAWLRTQFFADAAMSTWLSAPPEVAAGTATVASK
jgi:acetyl esterase/lipase